MLCEWQEPERKANAADIVMACNSHDDLLDACKAANRYLLESPDDVEARIGLGLMLEAAIAKAKGQEAPHANQG